MEFAINDWICKVNKLG